MLPSFSEVQDEVLSELKVIVDKNLAAQPKADKEMVRMLMNGGVAKAMDEYLSSARTVGIPKEVFSAVCIAALRSMADSIEMTNELARKKKEEMRNANSDLN